MNASRTVRIGRRKTVAHREVFRMPAFRQKTMVACALAAVAGSTVGITIPAVASAAHHSASRSRLPSVLPGSMSSLERVGGVASSTPVEFSALVRGRHAAELPAFAQAVSDPSSPQFRHFLTRRQARQEFDPAPAATQTVERGLRELGAQITGVSSDGRLVEATAPAGKLTTALGVHFANVRTDGGVARVALNEPVLPATIRPLVSDIIGLTQTPVTPMTTSPVSVTNAPAPAYFNGRPCSKYYGQKDATKQPRYKHKAPPYTICGYTPKAIRAAYRVPQSHLSGKGARIAIVDDYDSATIVQDTNHFAKTHGIAGLKARQFVDHTDASARHVPETVVNDPTGLLGSVPGESPQEWSGEQTLDVESVHTMAPKATIEYYGGDQGIGLQPLEAEFSQAVADDKAQFISDSWGAYELYPLLTQSDVSLMKTELQLGASQGIGAAFSSGDDGDNIEMNDVKAADFPASTNLATSVGGTTLVVGPHKKYVGETYWGTRLEPETTDGNGWDAKPVSGGFGPTTGPGTMAGAAGGGVSSLFSEPSWQKGIVAKKLTTQTYTSPDKENTNNVTSPGRVEPDVSLVADSTTGVLVGQTQTDVNGKPRYSMFRIGGTSVSCPLFAGLMALAIQRNHGKSIGFVSPSLYSAYKKSPSAFRKPSLGHKLVNVRTDYKNTQDPHSGVTFHLRLLGQLSSLTYRKGYDDSTGLGTPCAPTFLAAIDKPKAKAKTASVCRLHPGHGKHHRKR
jgi:subtilase family serine protease